MSKMISLLSDDLIRLVLHFCDSRSSFSFVLSCKQVLESTRKEGFAKHISFDSTKDDDLECFMNRMARHYRNINVCSLYRLQNPFLWMPMWVQKVEFYFCKITEEINPPVPVKTKSLKIMSNYNHGESISINWDKFPMLRELEILNLRVTNVDKCKNVKINLRLL
jgi:hypothetical protein